MGNTEKLGNVQTLIAERQQTHGDAYKVTNDLVTWLWDQNLLQSLKYHRLLFTWMMILNKLIRACFSPQVSDHWRDIQGWAELALKTVEETDKYAGTLPGH